MIRIPLAPLVIDTMLMNRSRNISPRASMARAKYGPLRRKQISPMGMDIIVATMGPRSIPHQGEIPK